MQANAVPKEKVREYLEQRRASTTPPDSLERIRELLGWRMIEEERQRQKR